MIAQFVQFRKMRLYTAKEAADILRVSKQTIWKYGREGKLEVIRFGRTVRYILPKEEKQWIEKNSENSWQASSDSDVCQS